MYASPVKLVGGLFAVLLISQAACSSTPSDGGALGVVDDGQLLGRVHVLRIRKWRQHRHVVGRADGDRERDRSDDGHEHRSGRDGHDGREHGDDGGEHGDDGRDGDDGARDGDDGRDGLDGIEHGDDGLDGVDDRHGDERRAAPG